MSKLNITRILFLSILIDFLEFTIILPLLPKILTYYGSGVGVSHVSVESRGSTASNRIESNRLRTRCTLKRCPSSSLFATSPELRTIRNGIPFCSEVRRFISRLSLALLEKREETDVCVTRRYRWFSVFLLTIYLLDVLWRRIRPLRSKTSSAAVDGKTALSLR